MIESTDTGTQELSPYEAANMLEGMFDGDDALPENDDELPEGDEEGEQAEDDDEDGEEEQKQPTSDMIEVKVNGEIEKVSLEELKSGYMKDAYFRQVTAEAANERREIAAEKAQTAEVGQQLTSLIDQYQQALQTVFNIARPDVRECYQQDPSGQLYAERQAAFEQLVSEFQQTNGIKEKVGTLTQEQMQRAEAIRQREVERQIMVEIPEWGADPDLAVKEVSEIGQFARKLGYTDDTLRRSSATDLKIFRDAMLWNRLQSKKPEVENRAKQLPPVKSGKPTGKASTAADRLKKTGSKKDAIAAVMNLL